MMKRMIFAGLALSLCYGQSVLAKNNESLPPSGSHFNLSMSLATLNVRTTTPHRQYPSAGIQVLTSGYRVSGNVRPTNDGFFLFSVSDTAPASIQLIGSGGTVQIKVCLDGVGKKYSCENQSVKVSNSHIMFVTSTTHNGNFGGVTGADAFCQSVAYQAGSQIPIPGLQFKALLLSSTRYPCSSINGGLSGSCGGSYAKDWPLISGTTYLFSNGVTYYNTVNQYGVFGGSAVGSASLQTEQGSVPLFTPFWTGIQSILTNSTVTDIIGWAYTDMNSIADSTVYHNNLANCNEFTDATGTYNGSFGIVGDSPPTTGGSGIINPLTWGNYFYFDNTQLSSFNNLFSTSVSSFLPPTPPLACNNSNQLAIVCVS